MKQKIDINLFEMVTSIANVVNILDYSANIHQEQVAYISFRIAKGFELNSKEREELILAAIIHDIGAFSFEDKLEVLDFDTSGMLKHSEIGAALLAESKFFARISKIIKYHHLDWNYGENNNLAGIELPLSSQILHLADKISILIESEENVLNQADEIMKKIKVNSAKKFNPQLVKVFLELAEREEFWLSSVTPDLIKRVLAEEIKQNRISLDIDELLDLSKIFSRIIDFRSPFTLTHSRGVAIVAEKLAELIGWSDYDCKKMRIAGYFHDLGKLAVPTEILEKPGKLSEEEFNIIRSHTFYTYYVLDPIESLSDIKE
ncbi:HD domain-containing protein [Orenia marismortui]|uniref:HD domain-containing protein n=1 Tax=Orenia marismortui TaxID=46469 RepID=A0A4R8H125_9FIRM|nr:HD domain-containing protein [Orenia marismortui]TDX53197.1 HD domain-containing protein [Orenia marismortui]